MAYVIVTN